MIIIKWSKILHFYQKSVKQATNQCRFSHLKNVFQINEDFLYFKQSLNYKSCRKFTEIFGEHIWRLMLVSINKVMLKLFRNARWFHVFIEAHISGCHLCSPTKSNCLKLCTTK